MTYEESLKIIHSALRFGIKPGLERIGRLLNLLGNPQDGLRCVHVAGTSGKGSTATAISCVLQAAGLKTGLTVSPYLEDFCERIQVNNINISRDALADCMEQLAPAAEQMAREGEPATEFELVTALAFLFFSRQHCDAAVLEVGLGGRFDATNIIKKPLVSVITPISYDHVGILGNTLSEIAFEKCGIIKGGGFTVSAPNQTPEALEVIMRCCAQRGNVLTIPNAAAVRVLKEDLSGSVIRYDGQILSIPVAGKHQMDNFITAYEALGVLRSRYGFPIFAQAVAQGFSRVNMPGRFELFRRHPDVILDVAHNPAKIKTTSDLLKRFCAGKKIVAVMGMLADKDYKKSIAMIAPFAVKFYALTPESPRALPAETTASVAAEFCSNVAVGDDYAQVYRSALEEAGEDGVVLVCGSFYLTGKMRKIARNRMEK